MTTKATSGQKCKLQRGDGAGTEVFATIAEITTITGPTFTAKDIDVTSVDSDAAEFIAGIADAGELSFEGNFVGNDGMQQGLMSDMTSRVVRHFQLLLADHATTPTKIAFSAVVRSHSMKLGVNAKVDFSCALKISGAPTITYIT